MCITLIWFVIAEIWRRYELGHHKSPLVLAHSEAHRYKNLRVTSAQARIRGWGCPPIKNKKLACLRWAVLSVLTHS